MNISGSFSAMLFSAILVSATAFAQGSAEGSNQTFDLDKIKDGVVGRIIVEGDVPELPPHFGKALQGQGGFCNQEEIPNESVMIGENGGLANVFVYIKEVPKGLEIPANHDKKTLKTIRCRFVPHAQIVQTGQPLSVLNLDPVADNPHFSGLENVVKLAFVASAPKGKLFTERVISLDHAEIVPTVIKDDLYHWKRAYILPLDHPFAGVTDKNGNFHIKALPPGSYDFVVWHEMIGYINKRLEVMVHKNKPTRLKLSVPAKNLIDSK